MVTTNRVTSHHIVCFVPKSNHHIASHHTDFVSYHITSQHLEHAVRACMIEMKRSSSPKGPITADIATYCGSAGVGGGSGKGDGKGTVRGTGGVNVFKQC